SSPFPERAPRLSESRSRYVQSIMARRVKPLARGVKRPVFCHRILRVCSYDGSPTRPLKEMSMMDGLISKFRIWHFGYVCRRDPERIGFELRRMLVELQGP